MISALLVCLGYGVAFVVVNKKSEIKLYSSILIIRVRRTGRVDHGVEACLSYRRSQ